MSIEGYWNSKSDSTNDKDSTFIAECPYSKACTG